MARLVMKALALTIISAYLPHQRSTLASWAEAYTSLISQHAAVQQEHPQDVPMIGGDLNQGNLAASTLRALSQSRLRRPLLN